MCQGRREPASPELSKSLERVGEHPGETGSSHPLGPLRGGAGQSRATYLRGHAAALAVVLGDELVEEQVDLSAGRAGVVRAQGAEPGRQAVEPTAGLRGRLPRSLPGLAARLRAGNLHGRHFSYVTPQGNTSGAFPNAAL